MSQSQPPIPEEMHVLAGEYVLGALDLAEMRAVRRQAMVDPRLHQAIAGWEQRLVPLTETFPEVAPPVALWERIERAVAPVPDDGEQQAPGRPVAAPPPPGAWRPISPARPPAPAFEPEPPPPRRVWPWQLTTVVSLAIAAGLAALMLVPQLTLRLDVPMLTERFSPRIAALVPAGQTTPGFLAEARPDGTVVLTAMADVQVPAGKALELWILPPGATAPRSLGVLPASGNKVTLPVMPPAGTALLVSVEPPGGSPTGAPTGPVVYAGKLSL